MKAINIIVPVEIVGPLCVAADDGQIIHDLIVSYLKKGEEVVVSFKGVNTMISAFLNAAIGQLYGEYSEETVRKFLSVSDMEAEDIALLKRVIENAKSYFANRKSFDAAWREETNSDE